MHSHFLGLCINIIQCIFDDRSGIHLVTCVVHVWAGVEGGGSAGLDLPPGSCVLGRPAAEGGVTGPAEVTGEPQEGCAEGADTQKPSAGKHTHSLYHRRDSNERYKSLFYYN